MYIIAPHLATHGLEWQFDNSLTEDDILHPDSHGFIQSYPVLDVRTRMQDAPNEPHIYPKLIGEAIALIQKHGKVVVCCSAGISRSNSIAVGVLMRWNQMSFEQAVKTVKDKVPIANMKECHLHCIEAL